MAQEQMNWYGLTGLTSPHPMTAEDFADWLRGQRGRVTYHSVRVTNDATVTAWTHGVNIEFAGKRG